MPDCAWCGKSVILDEEDSDYDGETHLKCSDEADRRNNENICVICGIKLVERGVIKIHPECMGQTPQGYPPV